MNITERELERLKQRIVTNQASAWSAHEGRVKNCREYLRQWNNRVKPPAAGEEEDSNFSVPYTQSVIIGKWAKVLQSLFGDDAEIVAEASGPSDVKTALRAGKFATVAFLRMMPSAALTLAEFAFKIIIYGRAHCFRRWVKGEDGAGNVIYEGPRVWALDPEDVVVPAEERVQCVQDFSWSHRMYWISPDEFLDATEGEEAQFNFAGHSKDQKLEAILAILKDAQQNGGSQGRDSGESVEIADEQAAGQGVQYDFLGDQGSERIRVWECYQYWRPLKKGISDASEDDLDSREMRRERVVIQYLPSTQKIVSVRNLSEVFDRMTDQVPIDDGAICCDGRYWTIGIGQQSYSIQEEMSAVHNAFGDALDQSQGPHIFFEPASGFDPRGFRYGAKGATPVANVSGIKIVEVKADIAGAVTMQNMLIGHGERAMGYSDQTAGRGSDRPNAPRTLGGQMLLAELGDVRAWIDLFFLREALSRLLRNLWEMYVSFGSEDVFFRITEEEADGLFEVKDGGAVMTSREFAGRYDFKIKFATSAVSKQARKVEAFEKFKAAMSLPIVQMNPRAQWVLLNELYKAMGDENFSNIVPEPADVDLPVAPKVEHSKMQQGEMMTTHPQDNDRLHMAEHAKALKRAQGSENPDPDYIRRLTEHVAEHQMQDGKKMLMRSLVDGLAESVGQQGGGVPGLPGATGPTPEDAAAGGGGQDAGQLMESMMNGGPEYGQQEGGAGFPGQDRQAGAGDFGLEAGGGDQNPRF